MPVKIFFCYAHKDEALLDELKMHLRPLQRQALIDIWYDRDISAGAEWGQEIDNYLNTADIVLLLVSPAFMDSDYCYGVEMKRAIERHEQGKARVIPIILKHIYWQIEPLMRLQALPKDAKPVVSREWHSQDEAFYNVQEGIRKVVDELTLKLAKSSHETLIQPQKPEIQQRFVNTSQRDAVKPEEFSLLRYISTSNVTSVAFSPDGQLLISGCEDKSTKLWDPYTGLLRTLIGYSDEVLSVAFSPNGQLLASGSDDGFIKLWDSHTGILLHTLTGHSEAVRSIAFSPDSQLLASGSYDNSIKLWNPRIGAELRTLTGHSDMIMSVAFSPDRQLLASGSHDNSIRLWDPYTGILLRTLTGHSEAARSIAFSPNSQLLASGSYDNSVKLWNPHTGILLRTLTGHSDMIMSVTFSPDGQLLASGSYSEDNAIIIWGKKDNIR